MAEFGRIIEKDIDEIERRWKKLEDKILNLIEKEDDNGRLQALLQSTGPTRDLPASTRTIVALCALVYLLPDTRYAPLVDRVLYFVPENTEIKSTLWRELPVPQPIALVRGSTCQPKDVFLMVDKVLVCKIPLGCSIPVALLGAFYVFNVHYTPGSSNIFMFLEVYLLDTTHKSTSINSLLAQLKDF